MTAARRETIWIGIATIVGAVVRLQGFSRLGIDHFDEGIYALSSLSMLDPRGIAAIDPGVIPYAPPVYPVLVAVAYLCFGVSDSSALLVSIASATATIPVAGWLGRRTFGLGAGAAAAWLAAFSAPHVAFSRTALTDPTALLTFLIALGLGARFLERPGLVRALAFGAAVGLAQNAKYNGLLSGLIVALAWLAGLWRRENRGQGPLLRVVGWGLVAAFLALAAYWPWYRFVEAHGGYASLVAHHRSYVDGPTQWARNALLQRAELLALSGRWLGGATWLPWALGFAAVSGFVIRRFPRSQGPHPPWPAWRQVLIVVAVWLFACFAHDASWALGIGLMPMLMISERPAQRVLGVALLVFAVLVPLYHPYARLSLPFTALCWLATAGLIADVLRGDAPHTDHPASPGNDPLPWTRVAAAFGAAVAIASFAAIAQWPAPVVRENVLQPRDGLRQAAWRIEARLQSGVQGARAIRVYARPPLLWYLARAGVPLQREATLDSLARQSRVGELAIVDELQAIQNDPRLDVRESVGAAWTVDEGFEAPASLVTRLDLDPANALRSRDDRVNGRNDGAGGRLLYVLIPAPAGSGR